MDKIVHFEIPADDTERAKRFYTACFEWQTEDYPPMNYVIARTGPVDKDRMPTEKGFINGGMMKRTELFKSPIVTILVKDIDASLKKIEENGGEVAMKKTSIGEMGSIAYFKDTEGNVIGLFEGEM